MAEFSIDERDVVQRRLAEVVRLVEARRGSISLDELNELLRAQCTTIEDAVILCAEISLTFAVYTSALVNVAAFLLADKFDIGDVRVRSILLDRTESFLEQALESGGASPDAPPLRG